MSQTGYPACARNAGRRAGTTIAMLAMFMFAIFAVLAFSIDIGYIAWAKSELQNAADAAALAAVKHIRKGNPEVADVAQQFVNYNLREPISLASSDVEFGYWDEDTATFTVLTGADIEDANAVRVSCFRTAARNNQVTLLLAPIIGHQATDVSASAIARLNSIQCGPFVGIDRVEIRSSSNTDSFRSYDGPYDASTALSNGHVCSNGPIDILGSAIVNGDAHPGYGFAVTQSGGGQVTGNTSPLPQPLLFPPIDPGDAAVTNDNGQIPLSSEGNNVIDANGNFATGGGESVALPPGIYYLNSISMSGGSTFVVTGPTTIYVAGNVDMQGGTALNMTDVPKNLTLKVMGSQCDFSGNAELSAIVYAPQTIVTRDGSSEFYGSIVAKELIIKGSGSLHGDESLDAYPVQDNLGRSRLVE